MTTIVTIVEGNGEVAVLPVLLRKLVHWEEHYVEFPRPKNAHGRNNLIKPGGIEHFLELARREQQCNGVLVLIDADEDCAKKLALELASRVHNSKLPFPVAIVCAKCEYEAWFLASLATIAGHADIPSGTVYQGDVEDKRGVKEWLTNQMPAGKIYKETQHQSIMTDLLDIELVQQSSRSFRRLQHALEELLAGTPPVTPDCNQPSP